MELDLNVLYPTKYDYNTALKLSIQLLKIGKPIPAVDIVISAIAINNGLRVVTKDRHFLFVKEVEGGFEVVVES